MQFTGSFIGLSAIMLACLSAVQAAPQANEAAGTNANEKRFGVPTNPVIPPFQLPDFFPPGRKTKSVIQLISDGFGPASETFARSFLQARDGLPWDHTLAIDPALVGTIRTRSTDSLVTDSAASATAYSCGVKSFNAAIGVDVDRVPCGTVLEAAKAKGYNTALVSTSRITHATPASYAAHTPDRDLENDIASQEIGGTVLGRQVDILWGGGARHFQPNTTKGSSRKDSRDLIAEARAANWTTVLNRADFDALQNGNNVKFPSLGLFTQSHMSYEIDRDAAVEPSLTEMTIAALTALKKAGKPFFIMAEAARIDHAAHNNDGIGHLHDILEYNKMFQAVTDWVSKNSDDKNEIIAVATSDHECGGLTLGLQRPEDAQAEYLWYPDVLFNSKHSTEFLSAKYTKYAAAAPRSDAELRDYMTATIIPDLGITDVSSEEVDRALFLGKQKDSGLSLTIWLASLVNWRAHLGWSTTGHSGVDVNLYVPLVERYKSLRPQFAGNHENTWIGQWIAKYLDLDLQAITKKLNNGTNVVAGAGSANETTVIQRYHGGVKRIVPPLPAGISARSIGYSHLDNDAIRRATLRQREIDADMADASHSHAKRSEL